MKEDAPCSIHKRLPVELKMSLLLRQVTDLS